MPLSPTCTQSHVTVTPFVALSSKLELHVDGNGGGGGGPGGAGGSGTVGGSGVTPPSFDTQQ